jgi:hypothetical protein
MRTFRIICLVFLLSTASSESQRPKPSQGPAPAASLPSLPSQAEINELLDKAREYVATYRRTFANAKDTLVKSSDPDFATSANTLCDQAEGLIATIKKSGSTGASLLSMLTVLDDMSLNASKASAAAMMVAVTENRSVKTNHAMQDFQDLAQAGKNCYDISGLLFHATFRYVSVEDEVIRQISIQQIK